MKSLLTDCRRYKLDKKRIISDLTTEKPEWVLSSYGPERELPIQLFGGEPREKSFEELRLRHYELAAKGDQQQAILEAQSLVSNAEQQIQTVVNDIEGAVRYLIDGEKQHPNRFDVCKGRGTGTIGGIQSQRASQPPSAFQSATAFGKPSVPTGPRAGSSSFGKPAFGQSATPATGFGKPAFGQPANTSSAFGQPAFGQTASTGSAFGTPSNVGQNASGFGKAASGLAQQGSGFGQASALGGQSNPFGQATGASQPSTLGRPSTSFGQPASGTTGFGQLSSTSEQPQNAFNGQTAATSAFGKPAFGNTAVSNTPSNAFNSNNNVTQANMFGQSRPPSVPNVFTSSPQTATSATTATQPSSNNNPFSMKSPQVNQQAFGQPLAQLSTSGQGMQTGKGDTIKPLNGGIRNATIPLSKDSQGRLVTWNGKKVTYIDNEPCLRGKSGSWEKVWFPDGAPTYNKTPDVAQDDYDEETKENYRHMMNHGEFKDGIMPLLPPRREWSNWDF